MNDLRRFRALIEKDSIILAEAKRQKDIIYGSRAVSAQLGPFAREPNDWDILAKNPQKSARRVEHRLDRIAGKDVYFTKQSKYHKETYKVKEIGLDNKRGTEDDIEIADYSLPGRRYKTIPSRWGVRLVDSSETLRDKQMALKQPELSHRFEKDTEDINRIKFFKKFIQNKKEGF